VRREGGRKEGREGGREGWRRRRSVALLVKGEGLVFTSPPPSLPPSLPPTDVHVDAMDVAGDNQMQVEHNMLKQRLSAEGQPIGYGRTGRRGRRKGMD